MPRDPFRNGLVRRRHNRIDHGSGSVKAVIQLLMVVGGTRRNPTTCNQEHRKQLFHIQPPWFPRLIGVLTIFHKLHVATIASMQVMERRQSECGTKFGSFGWTGRFGVESANPECLPIYNFRLGDDTDTTHDASPKR
jgi:hypothetical protein